MKLILRRDQKATGMLSKTITFYLDVRADLTEDERSTVGAGELQIARKLRAVLVLDADAVELFGRSPELDRLLAHLGRA